MSVAFRVERYSYPVYWKTLVRGAVETGRQEELVAANHGSIVEMAVARP
jgi:hypothetical protein